MSGRRSAYRLVLPPTRTSANASTSAAAGRALWCGSNPEAPQSAESRKASDILRQCSRFYRFQISEGLSLVDCAPGNRLYASLISCSAYLFRWFSQCQELNHMELCKGDPPKINPVGMQAPYAQQQMAMAPPPQQMQAAPVINITVGAPPAQQYPQQGYPPQQQQGYPPPGGYAPPGTYGTGLRCAYFSPHAQPTLVGVHQAARVLSLTGTLRCTPFRRRPATAGIPAVLSSAPHASKERKAASGAGGVVVLRRAFLAATEVVAAGSSSGRQ